MIGGIKLISEKKYIKECIKDMLPSKYPLSLRDKKRKLLEAIFWFKLSYKHLKIRRELNK